MSLFCLCIVHNVKKNEKNFYTQQIETIAKHYNCGVKFSVDWREPIFSYIQKDSLVINVLDNPQADNCELFLLPDGWYFNGQAAKITFRERIKLLQDIANFFIDRKYGIDFYLGQSGTQIDDFLKVALKANDLTDYLTKTIGINGIEDGLYIGIIQEQHC